MKYSAKNIVDRALSLADMSNTKFLSYKEKLDYLNEAFKQACQAAINKSAKYFIETVEVNGNGEWDLPEDFYQIESLRTTGGTIIPKHSASTSDGALSYDIVRNKLIIYGAASNLQLNYWTVPTFLSFPAEDTVLDVDINNILDCCDTVVIYRDNNYIYVYDISTGTSTELTEIPENVSVEVVAGVKYCWVAVSSEDTSVSYFINYKGKIISTLSDTEALLIRNDRTLSVVPDYQGLVVEANGKYYRIVEGGIEDIDTLEIIPYDKPIKIFRPTSFNGVEGLMINTDIWVNGEFIDTDVRAFEVIGLLKSDWTTGYGFLVNDGMDLVVKSFIPDTLLDFPNTLLFEYLSYILAYMFTLKSGADTTAVEKALGNAEYEFYNSLDNSGTYSRITNVYGA